MPPPSPRTLLLLIPVLAGACAAADGPGPGPDPAEACHRIVPRAELASEVTPAGPAGLELAIAASHQTLRRLQSPRITATLTNRGSEPVRLVLPGEGSRYGLRTPMLAWSVRPAGETDLGYRPLKTGGGPLLCGHIPPLSAEDLVTLAPGASLPLPGQVGFPYLGKPGTYRAVLWYENRPRAGWATWRMLAAPDPAVWDDLEASTPVLVGSNAIELTVVD